MNLEIICTECGADTLVRREPVYDGFTKTGERMFCASCGFTFGNESEVPYKEKKKAPKVFDESDKPQKLDIFDEEDLLKNCRHCEHYVVNPFVQRCSLHEKEVDATDICFDYQLKVDKPADESDQSADKEEADQI